MAGRKKWVVLIMLSFLLLFYISEARGKICDQVVAIVNQEILTQKELQGMIESLRKEKSLLTLDPNQVKEEALQVLIDERLQLQEAERRKISVHSEEIDQNLRKIKAKNGLNSDQELAKILESQHMSLLSLRSKIEKGILLMKLRDRAIHTKVQLSDREIVDYFTQQNKKGTERIRLSHILFSLPQKADEATVSRVRRKARQIWAKLQKGLKFSVAARQYSEDVDSARLGGDLGYLERDQICLPFQKEIARLKIGQTSQPIRTPFGFHLIQITDRQTRQLVKNSEQWNKIKEALITQKVQKLYQQWLEELRKQAYIEIK